MGRGWSGRTREAERAANAAWDELVDALGQVTDRFIYLEEGDIAEVRLKSFQIWNNGQLVKRSVARLRQDGHRTLLTSG